MGIGIGVLEWPRTA